MTLKTRMSKTKKPVTCHKLILKMTPFSTPKNFVFKNILRAFSSGFKIKMNISRYRNDSARPLFVKVDQYKSSLSKISFGNSPFQSMGAWSTIPPPSFKEVPQQKM